MPLTSQQIKLLQEVVVAKKQRGQLTKKEKLIEPIFKRTARGVQRSFKVWYKSFSNDFKKLKPFFAESALSEAPPPNMIDPMMDDAFDESDPILEEVVMDGIETAIVLGGETLLAELVMSGSFDVAALPATFEYIAERGAELVVQIDATTRRQMKTLLEQAAREGWSWQRTAEEIESRADRWGIIGPPLRPSLRELRTRAELIAVTEIGNAYEAGTSSTASQLQLSGLPMVKRWLTVGDSRVDPHCRANQAEGWIPLAQAHDSGAMHPLDHPGCRCTELYRVDL